MVMVNGEITADWKLPHKDMFFLCDTVIGLQVASVGYLILPAWLTNALFGSFPLAWAFYLPSQVMIALCGKKNR